MSSLLRSSFERRAFPSAPPIDGSALTIPAAGSGAWSTAGAKVTDQTAMSIVAFFAGVRIISDVVSTTPLRAVTVDGTGSRKPVIPSPEQITNPFMACSLQEGISQIVTSLILRGNAYAFVVARDPKTFKPAQVRVLHPDQVDVSWDKLGYRQYKIGGNSHAYGPDEVIHLTGFMLANSLKGVSLIECCRNALGIGIALEDVAGQFFSNGVMSSGIISVDAPMTDNQVRQTAEQFRARHSGTSRAYLPIVLSQAKYEQMSLTLEDAQFLESRQFSSAQMATLLGVPPHLLGIIDKTTSWGTGLETQGRAFVDYALRAFFTRLQNMFTSWLPDGMFSDFITDVITRADTETRYKNYSVALGGNNGVGWMNVDEVRSLEGLPPLPNGAGQVYYVAAAQVPTSDANGEIPKTPPAEIPPTDPATGGQNASTED